jgi:tRNA modification GTPase
VTRHSPADVIAALATPPGAGALAVVRVSGGDAIATVERVFRGNRALSSLEGFRGASGWIHHGPERVDEVVAWVYRAPRSYTGEDMVEVSCHGGPLPAARVLEALWSAGARPAEPGEFTRRAFLSGRIDLAQAEGVADLIAARGRRAQVQALAQLEGGLSRRVEGGAARIREVMARVEGHLDFGDDVPEFPDASELERLLGEAEEELRRLLDTHAPSRRARDGLTVALVGRPNVGKSSLLNALVGFDRALVHPAPGTTRDVVDATVAWDGIPVRLVDTAGIRDAAEAVEAAGIERSRREIARADVVLWVVDVSEEPRAEDFALGDALDAARTRAVLNKIDLPPQNGGGTWVNNYSPRSIHKVSAKTGVGIPDLVGALGEGLEHAPEDETVGVASERHAHLLTIAVEALARGRKILAGGAPLELGAADLHRALDALGAVTGDHAGEDLLDEIFRRFCIGK